MMVKLLCQYVDMMIDYIYVFSHYSQVYTAVSRACRFDQICIESMSISNEWVLASKRVVDFEAKQRWIELDNSAVLDSY